MTLSRVEHALDMMRIYLVECAAQDDWSDDRDKDLVQAIVACMRDTTIQAHLDSKLKWAEIAAAVGLNPFAFGRAFKLATGITPHQYIIRCRLRRATRLLAREELPLADIALEVGCSCQTHLTTLFRKHLGTTPGAFRALARTRQGNMSRFLALTAVNGD